jgi:VIT1/CCC1 family predicted Fe2+/Mn2+ transporter
MPLGQNSLYSYTMHVVIIGAFYIILPYLPGHITERGLINTSLQLGVLLLLWWMIRRQFAFDIVPR